MSSLFLLIPLAIVLLAGAIWAFFWAVGDGQFDDLESPGWSVLAEDDARAADDPAAARGDPAPRPPERPS
jgi:cbb3-type cytochrome oxidase maturation protein